MRPMNSKARKVEHLVAKFANERRASRGLDRLDSDRALTAAAREHSRDMARRGYVAHESDRHGGPSIRVKKYDYAGENVRKQYGWSQDVSSIAASALDGWMTSKDHRENILKSDYIRQGVGVWRNGDGIYITQMFLPKWADVEPSHQSTRPEDDPVGDALAELKRRLPI